MLRDLKQALDALSLLADEALADRILEEERIESAVRRVGLYDREGCHMCLMAGCRAPAVGKHVFAHCERHLDPWEKRWIEEEIETKPYAPPKQDQSEHPSVRSARELGEARSVQLAKENAENKIKALSEAVELLAADRRRIAERRAFLPQALRKRIDGAIQRQYRAIGKDTAT
jgi:hypothetical protein